MNQDDYDEYADGYESGEEEAEETGLNGSAQKDTDVSTGRNDAKSEVWWKGFHDGQDSTWNPPEEENTAAGEEGASRRHR